MSTVEQSMRHTVLTVRPDESLEQAAQAMIERRTGSAVVVTGPVGSRNFIGIVTERDVLRAVAQGRIPWSTKITEVMTADPVTVTPDVDTAEAIRIMIEGGFRHLPIAKEGKLIGLVSLRDILRATALPQIGLEQP